jgi:hypothetical protein
MVALEGDRKSATERQADDVGRFQPELLHEPG